MKTHSLRTVAILSSGVLALGVLAGCSPTAAPTPPASSSSTEPAGTPGVPEVTLTLLTPNAQNTVTATEAVIEAFKVAYPSITVELHTRPGGDEGANVVKTRLATGEMEDVFLFNSGALAFQLNLDSTILDLSGEGWATAVDPMWWPAVSTESGRYGAPFLTSQVGAMLYNRKVLEQLDIEVPTSWAEFVAAAEKVKNSGGGIDPVLQAYGDAWTAQMMVLTSFANVAQADSEWADAFTRNERRFVDEPAFEGWRHLEDLHTRGLLNEDFAAMTNDAAANRLAAGEAAFYPMLSSNVLALVQQNAPDAVNDIGAFATPADNPDHSAITVWLPNALFIPKTTEGDKLIAAKLFLEFLGSPAGCEAQAKTYAPTGPFLNGRCELPDGLLSIVADVNTYHDAGKASPALEFLSPVKGTNLAPLAVEVGSGIRSAAETAAAFDEDNRMAAQQLGLPGW